MPLTPDRVEMSDLLRELEQGAAAVRRNAVHVKDAIYGSGPEPGSDQNKIQEGTAVAVLRQALHDISRANDELVYLRDSCNMAANKAQSTDAGIATGSRY